MTMCMKEEAGKELMLNYLLRITRRIHCYLQVFNPVWTTA